MTFDVSIFNNMVIPIVLAACLIMGYIIKKWISDVDNKWIPTILTVFGALLACIVQQHIDVDIIVSGAFTGLASTGMHQAFKQIISND